MADSTCIMKCRESLRVILGCMNNPHASANGSCHLVQEGVTTFLKELLLPRKHPMDPRGFSPVPFTTAFHAIKISPLLWSQFQGASLINLPWSLSRNWSLIPSTVTVLFVGKGKVGEANHPLRTMKTEARSQRSPLSLLEANLPPAKNLPTGENSPALVRNSGSALEWAVRKGSAGWFYSGWGKRKVLWNLDRSLPEGMW